MDNPFRTASVVCRCGRLYFERQNEALWACARQHIEDARRLDEYQAMARDMMKDPVE